MAIAKNLIGQKFGRLTVIDRHIDEKSNTRWLCLCECGKTTVAVSGNLQRGKHKSCGCWRAGPTNYKHKDRTYSNGYALILQPNHPRANKHTGRVREHIVIMEEILDRSLMSHEEVHHKNGIRDDNRPENLELWTKSQPAGTRVEDKIEWAIQILKTYAPQMIK